MGEPDPRLKKLRRTGATVFMAVAVTCIPIGVHIVRTRESPEIWLTLLGSVLMLILICLYALETALSPIPEPRTVTPASVDPDADTILDEPGDSVDLTEEAEAVDPSSVPEIPLATEDADEQSGPSLSPVIDENESLLHEGASLVEAEEVPTHPPFGINVAATEQGHSTNPDGPMLTVPNPALEKAKDAVDDEELTDRIADEATE